MNYLHPRPSARGLLAATAGVFAFALGVRAQTTDTDEVVRLSEFTVRPETQSGYTASESMSGSRIATSIKDLPYNVNVITREFLDDFSILDNSDIFQGGVITSDWDAGSGYTIRGISNDGKLYNGFWIPSSAPVANALIDRIEVLNGPSAGAYGQTAPGGIVNYVPRQPKKSPQQSIRFMLGSYNMHNVRADSTGPLNANTQYLAVVDYAERSYPQRWHENRSRSAAFSLAHQFGDGTNFKLDLVGSSIRGHSPSNRVPYLYDSKAQRVYGIAYNLMERSMTGPNSYSNSDNYSVFGTADKTLNDIFSLRVGADLYSVHNRSFNTTDVTAYDPDPTHLSSDPYNSSFYGVSRVRSVSSSYSAPSYKLDYKDGGGTQMDLLARYPLLAGKVQTKTLFTLDFSSVYNYVIKKGMPAVVKTKNNLPQLNSDGSLSTSNAADPTVFPRTPRFAGDTAYWTPLFDPNAPEVFADPVTGFATDIYNLPVVSSPQYELLSWQKVRTDDFGVMLREQATVLKKLLLFGSIRFDNVMYNAYTISYPSWSVDWHPEWTQYYKASFDAKNKNGMISHYHSTGWTPNAGFSYAITPSISAYGNYSRSFKISTQQVSGATTGSYWLPNERANGYDYGLKGSFLNGRVTATAGGFYILQENMSVTVELADGSTIKEASGTVTSRGFALTGNYNASEHFGLNAEYYHTDARWGNTGVDLDLSGRTKARVPPDILELTGTYRFDGRLRGLRAYLNYQYTSPTPAEDRGGKSVGNITPVGSNNGLRDLRLPSYALYNPGVAYDFQSRQWGRKLRHTLQFNVVNAADKRYVTYSRGAGDGRSYRFSYRLQF